MSGARMLNSELTLLAALSKKRNEPLKLACARSLGILAKLEAEHPDAPKNSAAADTELSSPVTVPGTPTLSSALAAEPEFVEPFLLACSLSSAKSCASALQCLQWMLSNRAMAPERLHSLLEALFEAAQLGSAIQLKILQLLPLILQNYDNYIRGPLVADLLHVSAELHGENKVAMVHNAAYATLQQLIDGLFERVSRSVRDRPEQTEVFELVANADSRESPMQKFEVTPDELDAAKVLVDLCLVAERNPPKFTRMPKTLTVTFTLELLELTLTNHAELFWKIPLFGEILRQKITPLLIQLFSESTEFALTLRTIRTFYLLLRRHLRIIHLEAEVILSLLGSATSHGPRWKTVLCLEVFQGLFLEFKLVLKLFTYPSIRAIITSVLTRFADTLADGEFALPLAVVRASQTVADQDVSDVASISSKSSTVSVTPTHGPARQTVLSRASMAKLPFIDLLDKTEPPKVSTNYVIYLILVSTNALSEGLSKFAQGDKRSSETAASVLVELEDPVIRCYTAFLGGSMELELYKTVVKSVQRFSHAAGILDLEKTRDDYMNMLAQFSLPPEDPQIRKLLNLRHILCIRALFNLCFALGNKLGPSWSIFAECVGKLQLGALQEATSEINRQSMFGNAEYLKPAAASLNKLLESTADLDDSAIVSILDALGSLGQRMLPIHLYIIEAVACNNADRISVSPSACWNALEKVLLNVINDDDVETSRQMLAAHVLNESIRASIASCSSDTGFTQLLSGVKAQIRPDNDRANITLGAMHTLERILEQFGDKITAGWDIIFSIITAFFELDKGGLTGAGRSDLIKSSFHSLELICADFLYHCPENCLHLVISSLDRFARLRADDINISFTAISLFWLVCDHLMRNLEDTTKFPPVDNEKVLAELAISHGSNERVALWLLAVLRLASIANEPQHQLKIGAIHIVFRLFQSHDSLLPESSWNTCLALVFPSLMSIEPDQDGAEATETYSLLLAGLSELYRAHLRIFVKMPKFAYAWTQLIDFYRSVVDISAQDSVNVYKAFGVVVTAASEYQLDATKAQTWEFWIERNSAPEIDSQRPRKTVEAIQLLVSLYPVVAALTNPSIDQQKDAIRLVANAAKYPYSGEALSSTSPSTSQLICLEQLASFDTQDNSLQALLVSEFSDLALLPYRLSEDKSDIASIYFGMSRWSQAALLSKLRDLASDQDLLDYFMSAPEAPMAVKTTLEVCLCIMAGPDRDDAVMLYLLILDWSGHFDLGDISLAVVKGIKLILEGSPNTAERDLEGWEFEIGAVGNFVEILEAHSSFNDIESIWKPVLRCIANNSLLYERGLISVATFEGEFPINLDGPFFPGTITPPTRLPRKPLRYWCLEILKHLATKSEQYAKIARELYIKRVKLVLHQYIGDLQVRGMEPMPSLLYTELQTVLQQLNKSDVLPDMAQLIPRCIASPDSEVRAQVQAILLG